MMRFYDLVWRMGLRWFVRGLNYSRAIEYPAALRALDPLDGTRLLDIGSAPFSLWPLYVLGRIPCRVCLVDLGAHVAGHRRNLRTLRKTVGVRGELLACSQQDARRMAFATGSFERISCISVVEHIPDEGDREAMAEIGRLLAPGGMAFVTVPFGPVHHEKWYPPERFPVAVEPTAEFRELLRRPAPAGTKRFFERIYDRSSLFDRIVAPSGLALKRFEIAGERRLPLIEVLDNRPRILKAATNWAVPFLAAAHFTRLRPAQVRSESIALLTLHRA